MQENYVGKSSILHIDKIISVMFMFMFNRMVIYFKRLTIMHPRMIKLKKTEAQTC